jgi:mannose-6-phosphate isomerase
MKPFKFKQNRVHRVYLGGALIDELRNDKAIDALLPEDWIASIVKANNPQIDIENEGLSTAIIKDREILFTELVNKYSKELLGKDHIDKFGKNLGILTKILDSAIRLPLQVHPDNKKSLELYNSKYGKTECWIVLGTRKINNEEPYLILGFNDKLDEELFCKEALVGEFTNGIKMVHKHKVKPGDVIMLKGGTVHAIGPGVFLIEIMEPTDLVTQPELYCGPQKLTDMERFGVCDHKKALHSFHFTPKTKEQAWNDAILKPTSITKNSQYELTLLINRDIEKYFGGEKLNLTGKYKIEKPETFKVGIVTQGSCSLTSKAQTLELNSGDTFFIPHSSKNLIFEGNAEIIFALPPTYK